MSPIPRGEVLFCRLSSSSSFSLFSYSSSLRSERELGAQKGDIREMCTAHTILTLNHIYHLEVKFK